MRLRAFGERERIPVVTLVPYLQGYADAEKAFLHGFANTGYGVGHWNDLGHRLAGERIAAALCASMARMAMVED